MRSVNRLAAAAALALAACGNYSTEDLRFLAALPTREDLRVEVPVQEAPGAAAGAMSAVGDTCGPGNVAETWLWAKPTSDKLNAMVEFLVGLVDVVRLAEPSWRGENGRAWGPFDDRKHPGREIRVGLGRTYPEELGGRPRHVYIFEARVKGDPAWTPVLAGEFDGASATLGSGWLILKLTALQNLGMADDPTSSGDLYVRYDRASDPRTVALVLDADGFGLPGGAGLGYAFAGWDDGTGRFDYAFRNAAGDVL
jgi:hypothetical protein